MFSKLKSVKKLQELSLHPINLTQELTPSRIEEMKGQNAGWKLLYGTERVDARIMDALFDLAYETKALSTMAAMQEGETLNKIDGYASW